jgi:tryptophan synthase alpha chain
MKDRYATTFSHLSQRGEGAFIPFTVLGDPDPDTSLGIIHALVQGDADGLELGFPFSDPIADGPIIQAADLRALEAGTRQADAWSILQRVRQSYPDLPLGLLVYANLVEARGAPHFYASAAQSGVDSVLIADVPTIEAQAYIKEALLHDILPVMIATPTATDEQLQRIAELTQGYTYVVTRRGVTGADQTVQLDHQDLLRKLAQFGAPPAVMGFGISQPEHVRSALAAGAAGAISGSAVVSLITKAQQAKVSLEALTEELRAFVRLMKGATR